MARAELGQQTASGISFMGVKQIPQDPSLSFTPVKKIPITTRSMVIVSKSLPRISWISSMVSVRIEPGREREPVSGLGYFLLEFWPDWKAFLIGFAKSLLCICSARHPRECCDPGPAPGPGA